VQRESHELGGLALQQDAQAFDPDLVIGSGDGDKLLMDDPSELDAGRVASPRKDASRAGQALEASVEMGGEGLDVARIAKALRLRPPAGSPPESRR